MSLSSATSLTDLMSSYADVFHWGFNCETGILEVPKKLNQQQQHQCVSCTVLSCGRLNCAFLRNAPVDTALEIQPTLNDFQSQQRKKLYQITAAEFRHEIYS